MGFTIIPDQLQQLQNEVNEGTLQNKIDLPGTEIILIIINRQALKGKTMDKTINPKTTSPPKVTVTKSPIILLHHPTNHHTETREEVS